MKEATWVLFLFLFLFFCDTNHWFYFNLETFFWITLRIDLFYWWSHKNILFFLYFCLIKLILIFYFKNFYTLSWPHLWLSFIFLLFLCICCFFSIFYAKFISFWNFNVLSKHIIKHRICVEYRKYLSSLF